MAIMIKNLSVPKKCCYCPLGRYYFENGNLWCNALNEIIATIPYEERLLDSALINIEKPDFCPIEGIPNSDLVDIKDIESMLEEATIISDEEYSGYCTEDIKLSNLPIIIRKENLI